MKRKEFLRSGLKRINNTLMEHRRKNGAGIRQKRLRCFVLRAKAGKRGVEFSDV